MEYVIAVDPGIRGCGVALFRGGVLVDCEYVRNPVKKGADFDAVVGAARAVDAWCFRSLEAIPNDVGWSTRVVLEFPQVYTASKSKGDNNDLLPLAAVDGAIAALLGCPATRVAPRDWKGSMAHEAVEHRVASRLDGDEMFVIDEAFGRAGKTLAHNVTDAVGIGLHAVGRFTPRKAIAR
jgi:hypothetical protein